MIRMTGIDTANRDTDAQPLRHAEPALKAQGIMMKDCPKRRGK